MARVRADSFCNVFTLSVEHFLTVLERYPNMRTMMKQIAKKRFDDFGKEIKMENCIGNCKSKEKWSERKLGSEKNYKKMKRRKKKSKKKVQIRKQEVVNILRKNLQESNFAKAHAFDCKANKPNSFKSISSSPGGLNFSELKKKKNNSFSGIVALRSIGGRLDALTLEALTGLESAPPEQANQETLLNDADDDDGGISFKAKSDTVITTLDIQD